MKRGKIVKFITVMLFNIMIITSVFATVVKADSEGANGVSVEFTSGFQHPYTMTYGENEYPDGGSYFCTAHNRGLNFYIKTSTAGDSIKLGGQTSLTYDGNTEYVSDIEPASGYAFYVIQQDGLTTNGNADLQNVLWASDSWTGTSNMTTHTTEDASSRISFFEGNMAGDSDTDKLWSRAYRFGNVYYGMLRYTQANESVIKVVSDENNLKVMVDQDEKSYVVGPYVVGLNDKIEDNNFLANAKKYLVNELNGINSFETEENRFATYSGISVPSGSKISVVDENGNEYSNKTMPDIGSTFYVKYTNIKDEDSFDLKADKPVLDISILNGKFSGNVTNLSAKSVTLETNENVSINSEDFDRLEKEYDENGQPRLTNFATSGVSFPNSKNILTDYSSENDEAKESAINRTIEILEDSDEGYASADVSFDYSAVVVTTGMDNNILPDYQTVPVTMNFTAKQPISTFANIASAKASTVYVEDENGNNFTTTDTYAITDSDGNEYYSSAYTENLIKNYTYFDANENEISYEDAMSNQSGAYFKYPNSDELYRFNDVFVRVSPRVLYSVSWDGSVTSELTLTDWVQGQTQEISTTLHEIQNIEAYVQPLVRIELQPGKVIERVTPQWDNAIITLPTRDVSIELGGHLWLDTPDTKVGGVNGIRDANDPQFAGIQCELVEKDSNKVVATTLTDAEGKYRFYGRVNGKLLINPFKKYYINYVYNGQYYQSTYYKDNIAANGGYSNAKDIDRNAYNTKFETIYSDPANFNSNGWKKAFALDEKLYTDLGAFVQNDNGGALTYSDAWEYFKQVAARKIVNSGEPKQNDSTNNWSYSASYDDVYGEVETWLRKKGINKEIPQVIEFMKQSMIKSTTNVNNVVYPKYNQYVADSIDTNKEVYNADPQSKVILGSKTYTYIFTKHSDQNRYVDVGLTAREVNDLALQKDVYKATLVVNGKAQDYIYNKKNLTDGSWNVNVRASDALYNGNDAYERAVRKSEYLYDSGAKNLQVYVTYRIAVLNQGQVNAKVNEIVDYYDASTYEFDNSGLNGDNYTIRDFEGKATSYNGSDANGNALANNTLKVNNKGIDNRGPEQISYGTEASERYDSLYLTGINSESGDDILTPGELAFVYVTFKVKNDPTTGKVMLDQDLNNGTIKTGKRNIAEINAYSTYYKDGTVIPDYLDDNNNKVGITVTGNATRVAGLIDRDSNPGNLSATDLDKNGNIITDPNDKTKDRLENDTDKSPNIKIIIDTTGNNDRTLVGYAYEDERNQISNKAVVGNGRYDNGENKINGVTVQLVELVSNIDKDGISNGTYQGEKVWYSHTYTDLRSAPTVDYSRYYTGSNTSRVILSGADNTILKVNPDELAANEGMYSFKSVPAGDFYIRFIYGDTEQTVLTNEANEVNALVGKSGLNAKSYNGQDYKTTTYQVGVNQEAHNGINGYVNFDTQNYGKVDDLSISASNDTVYNIPGLETMYSYNIASAATQQGVSDAKDVYAYRDIVNNWSKGANGTELLNNRAEILASFERVSSGATADTQNAMIKTLMNNTKMVAQTGIIDTRIEKDTTVDTKVTTISDYVIDDIDLGLEERPAAQIKMNKEVANFKMTLANGNVLFDANQSQKNLYFKEHAGHKVNYEKSLKDLRLESVELSANSKETPELLQTYLDDELTVGATLNVTYKITAENVGEVDYLDKQFYYTGSTNNNSEANIAKTSVNKVVDYVTNGIKYDETKQTSEGWSISSRQDLTDHSNAEDDLVNRIYGDKIGTYDTVLTSTGLNGALTPTTFSNNNNAKDTTLVLSTLIGTTDTGDNLVYNNLVESVSTTNTVGRRMKYSISGNQNMADQSLGNGASADSITSEDLVHVDEIDADSAQKVVLLPPTGANKNYLPIMAALLVAAGLMLVGVVLIRKSVIKENK